MKTHGSSPSCWDPIPEIEWNTEDFSSIPFSVIIDSLGNPAHPFRIGVPNPYKKWGGYLIYGFAHS
jgi:hypothetical protein